MVQTTIVRTPNLQAHQAPPRRAVRRPPFYGGHERGLEERGSLVGTIMMVVFSLGVISWVLLGAA